MADTKISALPASTTPLAGTETLPIVQGGVTKKVSVANLTTGRAVASAGGTFSDNHTQGTAAKGINFTANTPAAGMTSQLLNDYQEGTWTPTLSAFSGTITTVGTCTGTYTKIGRQVTLYIRVEITTNGTGAGFLSISGLPFTPNLTTVDAYSGSGASSTTGKALSVLTNSTYGIVVRYYDATYPGADNSNYYVQITYDV